MIAGDFNDAVLGLRRDITMEMFSEGVVTSQEGEILANLLQEDRSAVRVTFRAGYVTASPVRQGGAAAYPFAVLKAPTPSGGGEGGEGGGVETHSASARTSAAAARSGKKGG